jgi:hypothetical protein
LLGKLLKTGKFDAVLAKISGTVHLRAVFLDAQISGTAPLQSRHFLLEPKGEGAQEILLNCERKLKRRVFYNCFWKGHFVSTKLGYFQMAFLDGIPYSCTSNTTFFLFFKKMSPYFILTFSRTIVDTILQV